MGRGENSRIEGRSGALASAPSTLSEPRGRCGQCRQGGPRELPAARRTFLPADRGGCGPSSSGERRYIFIDRGALHPLTEDGGLVAANARQTVQPVAPTEINVRNEMNYEARIALMEPKPSSTGSPSVSHSEQVTLDELVEVLSAHPRGLRRWSVMRAIRASRSRRGREIPHKLEDDVERTFRRHCADGAEVQATSPSRTLFYRPKETAGEVWAVLPARADDPTAPL